MKTNVPTIKDPLATPLRNLLNLSRLLKSRRKLVGALELASSEIRFEMDSDRNPKKVEAKKHLSTMSLIEEVYFILVYVTTALCSSLCCWQIYLWRSEYSKYIRIAPFCEGTPRRLVSHSNPYSRLVFTTPFKILNRPRYHKNGCKKRNCRFWVIVLDQSWFYPF